MNLNQLFARGFHVYKFLHVAVESCLPVRRADALLRVAARGDARQGAEMLLRPERYKKMHE